MDLNGLRARIDTVDRILVDLLNRRMEYALEIGRVKRALGQQVQDAEREKMVLDGTTAYNGGPLSDEAVVDIFTRIMQEARNLEEE